MIEVAYLSVDKNISELEEIFIDVFSATPLIIKAPAPVHFIGGLSDKYGGSTLSTSIDQCLYVAISPNENSDIINLILDDTNSKYAGNITDLAPSSLKWPDHINALIDQLIKKGVPFSGFNCVIKSDIPLGDRMNAALAFATAFALNENFDLQMDELTLCKLVIKAGKDFSGIVYNIADLLAISEVITRLQ